MVQNRITVRLGGKLQQMIRDLRAQGYNTSSLVRMAIEKYVAELLLDNSGIQQGVERE